MADNSTGAGGWTIGIVVIVATLLIGSAVPLVAYFAVYEPLKAKREDQDAKLKQLEGDLLAEEARREKVNKLATEADEVEQALLSVESGFTPPNQNPILDVLRRLSSHYNIRPDKNSLETGLAYAVTKDREELPNGLKADFILIKGVARYYQIVDFLHLLERLDHAPPAEAEGEAHPGGLPEGMRFARQTIILGYVSVIGDPNAGDEHVFSAHLYVVKQRDISAYRIRD